MGIWSRVRDQLTRSSAQLEAAELSESAQRAGADPLSEVTDRARIEAVGVLRQLSIPPRGQLPGLSGELYDGTGSLTLIWLGRREIPGLACGVRVRVRGRVTMRRGRPVVYNPMYEILPGR